MSDILLQVKYGTLIPLSHELSSVIITRYDLPAVDAMEVTLLSAHLRMFNYV